MNCIVAGAEPKFVACANPNALMVALHDISFQKALHSCDLLLPDGIGIVAASRMLGGTIQTRIAGNDLFSGVCAALEQQGRDTLQPYRVFFLGATEATLVKMRGRMEREFPHIQVAGIYSPPFKEHFDVDDNQKMLLAINAAGADVLWVGMTAPKQEKWILEHQERLNVRLAAAVGAVFDFFAGNIQRAPAVLQRLGLEWCLRVLKEPRRMRGRAVNNVRFALAVCRAVASKGRVNAKADF